MVDISGEVRKRGGLCYALSAPERRNARFADKLSATYSCGSGTRSRFVGLALRKIRRISEVAMSDFPYKSLLMNMEDGQEEVIIIEGKAFIVSPATESDVERVAKGFFILD